MTKKVIGLTGPTSAGKDTVAEILLESGTAEIIQADEIGHAVYQKGTPGYQEIVKAFGPGILDANQEVNREELAKRVFRSPRALGRLNRITHPRIRAEILKEVKKSRKDLVVVNAALLNQMDVDRFCDEVWVILASRATRLRRLMTDKKVPRPLALARMRSQKPDSYYRKMADVIIRNDGTKPELIVKIRELIASQ